MFFRRLPRWQLLNDGQAVGGLGAPHELQEGSGRALWASKGAERRTASPKMVLEAPLGAQME